MNNVELAQVIIEKVGTKDNIESITHCMTRLRFVLKDVDKVLQEELKALDEVMGVVYKGGQYQLIIGPQVSKLYDEIVKQLPDKAGGNEEVDEKDKAPTKLSLKGIGNSIMNVLSASMVAAIPIMLVCGLSKALVAVLGPQLLGVFAADSSFITLFTIVGDAGFYFLPIVIGYTSCKKFNIDPVMGMLLGAVLVHPTLIAMVNSGAKFDVYGIPAIPQNYTSTVLPIIISVWVMSYVYKFLKKYVPNALQVVFVPFLTIIIMLPLTLCVFGPAGSFIGNYVGNGLIALYNVCGPLAVALLGAFFSILVMSGMHTVLFVFLFTTFPVLGFDGFMIPAMFASSYVSIGVAVACIIKFKQKKNKDLTLSYLVTWFFGGVGEPMLYGLNVPYKTPMYASVISGGLTGLVGGLLGLKAYVLTAQNGIYFFAAFLGGPQWNYIALAITTVVAIVSGFVVMWMLPLEEKI